MTVDTTAITSPSFASFSVTDRTQGRSVHNVLLDAMFAKSRFLELLGAGIDIPQPRHEWISLAAPVQTFTATSSTVAGSGTNKVLTSTAGPIATLRVGTLLVDITTPTPIGTYLRNEILMVEEMTSGTTVTVARDFGNFAGGATNGSTAHVGTDTYRIIGNTTQEGSVASLDPNTYSADTILENFTQINTMKMQLTGSQKARAMQVVDSEVERQWQRELIKLKNQRVSNFLYGTNSSATTGGGAGVAWEGSQTNQRAAKGILDFMVDNIVSANSLVDYTTTTLTYSSINNQLIKLFNNGADPSQNFTIVCSAAMKDVIGTWDADLVRMTTDQTQVGREIVSLKSTLGFVAEVVAEPMCQKNDLFILDMSKITPATFRPYDTQQWGKGTASPNGDDMWYQRTIGEETLMMVDPGYGHACMTALTWV